MRDPELFARAELMYKGKHQGPALFRLMKGNSQPRAIEYLSSPNQTSVSLHARRTRCPITLDFASCQKDEMGNIARQGSFSRDWTLKC